MGGTPSLDDKKPVTTDPNIKILSEQLGIWHLQTTVEASFQLRKKLAAFYASIPLLFRLMSDIYRLAPSIFILYLLSNVWEGLQATILMDLSNRLLKIIEIGLKDGNPDTRAIMVAIGVRLSSLCGVAAISWWSNRVLSVLKGRVKHFFELNLMSMKLKADLPTSQDASNKIETTSAECWSAFRQVIEFLTELMSTASQLALIYQLSKSTGGPLFTILCVAKPLASTLYGRTLWDKVSLSVVSNAFHTRMNALEKFMGDDFRQDIINGNLEQYIVSEYQKAHEQLGDEPDDHPFTLYSQRSTPLFGIGEAALTDLTTIYCALSVIINPSKLSLASIAILQTVSQQLQWSIASVFHSTERYKRSMNTIKNYYQTLDLEVKNQVSSGRLSYPRPDTDSRQGMALELRNVSFSYPGRTEPTNALNNVSLSIQAGQLVVIVGANGGGKSTLIKLFSRLYDPTSGEILIDGVSADQYQTSELRHATTILSQSSQIFPFSLGENIGLGFPDHVADAEMISKAAEKGGAADFISKMAKGMDTSLLKMAKVMPYNLRHNVENPLYAKLKEIEKDIKISGGEEQRLTAARTFMRFNTGKIKLVAVDEPSSALDPEAELQLFENLIEARAGKTMVFVTHRFGHLTKHADQIICMKDGAVAESGTHQELMLLGGEYAKLFEIQASAFTSAPPTA